MPKQVNMWEAEDGDLFESEAEAAEHEAKNRLRGYNMLFLLTENDFDLLHKVLDDKEFTKLLMAYGSARVKAKEEQAKRNERPEEIKKILE